MPRGTRTLSRQVVLSSCMCHKQQSNRRIGIPRSPKLSKVSPGTKFGYYHKQHSRPEKTGRGCWQDLMSAPYTDSALSMPVRENAIITGQAFVDDLRTNCMANHKPAISPTQLGFNIQQLQSKPNAQPFIFAYTLAFTTFVRQANLAPPTAARYDGKRHTSFKDIVKTPTDYGLSVFWTKTRQKATVPEIIPLPIMKVSMICSTTAWRAYRKSVRGKDRTEPLLVIAPAKGKSGMETIDLPLLIPRGLIITSHGTLTT